MIRFRLLLFMAGVFTLLLSASAQVRVTPDPRGGPVPRRHTSDEVVMAERARRAEQSGDYNRALTLWREIHGRSPWNAEAVTGVPRTLIVLKQYDEAEAFLKDQLQRAEYRNLVLSPADPTSRFSLALLLGQVALARGDEKAAWDTWNAALEQNGKNTETIRTLVVFLQQNRRWEDSERLIRDFRKESKQPAFMALELANSLRSQMNFTGATQELLLYAESSPSGWQLAMNYLDQFPDDSTVADKVTALLRKAARGDRKNATLWRLVAGYELKAGNLEESLGASMAVDSLTKAKGAVLVDAAEHLLQEGDVELARRGFRRTLDWQPASDVAARAELGLGRCSEVLGRYDEARAAYDNFITKNPRAREADEARFRIAEILLFHDGRPADALPVFTTLWQHSLGVKRALVGLRIGDCHAWSGDFEAAIRAWDQSVHGGGASMEDVAQALLRMARANFWRDSTSDAMLLLDSITTLHPGNTAFNDAVLYAALIGESDYYRAVRAFADGDYASFRRDDSTAARKFGEAADQLRTGRMAEAARLAQALALREAGDPQAAIAVLDTFVVHYPLSVDLDRAKYTRAVIRMEDLHDAEQALAEFQNFLVEHPRSLYLEQARRKARLLQAKAS